MASLQTVVFVATTGTVFSLQNGTSGRSLGALSSNAVAAIPSPNANLALRKKKISGERVESKVNFSQQSLVCKAKGRVLTKAAQAVDVKPVRFGIGIGMNWKDMDIRSRLGLHTTV